MSDKTAHSGPPDDGDESVTGVPAESGAQVRPGDAPSVESPVAQPDVAKGTVSGTAERSSPAAESEAAPAREAVSGTADSASGEDSGVAAASAPGADAASGPDADSGGASGTAGSGAAGGRSKAQADSGAEVPRRRGPAPRALLAGLVVAVVLLVGAVGAAGYLFVEERDKAELLAAHDEVRDAACEYAPVLANYDANNLEPYFRDVLAGASGAWKQEFETTTGELSEALVAGQVVSTAGDIQCAVKTADATSAEVVVVIGQTVTSLGTGGQPAPGQLAVVMRMQKTDGHWFVDQMSTPLSGSPLPPTG